MPPSRLQHLTCQNLPFRPPFLALGTILNSMSPFNLFMEILVFGINHGALYGQYDCLNLEQTTYQVPNTVCDLWRPNSKNWDFEKNSKSVWPAYYGSPFADSYDCRWWTWYSMLEAKLRWTLLFQERLQNASNGRGCCCTSHKHPYSGSTNS